MYVDLTITITHLQKYTKYMQCEGLGNTVRIYGQDFNEYSESLSTQKTDSFIDVLCSDKY